MLQESLLLSYWHFLLGSCKSQYKNVGFNDEYYRNLIVKYLEEYKSGTRENFRILLMDKLSDNLDEKQKAILAKWWTYFNIVQIYGQ